MDVRASLNCEENIAVVTGDGSATAVENDSFFAKVPPLAASTVGRSKQISRRLREVEQEMGSFLDETPKRRSPFHVDVAQPPSLLFSDTSAYTDQQIDALGNQLAEQMKRSMMKADAGGDDWSEPGQDDSTSLGILNVDHMDLLSNEEFLEAPIEELLRQGDPQQARHRAHDTPRSSALQSSTSKSTISQSAFSPSTISQSTNSQSSIKGASGDSHTWRGDGSSTAFQDSKGLSSDNDSKPEPFARSNIGTVKKYPAPQAKSNKGVGMGAAICHSLFAGLPIGEEGEDGDASVYDVELEAADLHQLDADFGEIDCSLVYDSDHDDVQPRVGHAATANGEDPVVDSIYLRPGLTANGDGADEKPGKKHSYLSKVSLFDENDNDFANSGSDLDTEDELDLVRKARGMRREVAGEASQAQLARPGLEGGCALEPASLPAASSSQLPITQRQSAEGDVVTSPVPGDGGGGGDGSSGTDSDDGRTQGQAQYASGGRDAYRYNDASFNHASSQGNQEQRIRPMGDDLLSEMRFSNSYAGSSLREGDDTRLPSRYLLAISSTDNTSLASFNIDDFLSSRKQSGDQDFDPGNRLEASGFNADDNKQSNSDPFGNMESSFGSFGLNGSQRDTSLVPGVELGAGFSFDAGDRFPDSTSNVRERLTGEAAGYERRSGDAGRDISGGDPWEDMVGSNRTSLASKHSSTGQYSRTSPRQGLSPVRWSSEGGDGASTAQSVRSPSRSSGERRSTAPGSPASSVSLHSLAGSDQNLCHDDFGDNDGFKKPLPPPPKSNKANMTRSKVSQKPHELSAIKSGDQAEQSMDYVDLALRFSLSTEAAEQREQLKRVPSIGGTSRLDLTVPDADFFDNAAALAMLDADEDSYEKDNVLRQDDAMLSQSSISPDDSWAYRSIMSIARPSWLEDPNDAEKIRISVGTFIRGRTGALGSLDGDENVPRPEFGLTVVTPPRENRRPSRLIDVTEENITDDTQLAGDNSVFLEPAVSKHECEGEGGDGTLTLDSLGKAPGDATLNFTTEMERLGVHNKTVVPDTSALTLDDVSMFFKSVQTSDPTQLGKGLMQLQQSKHRPQPTSGTVKQAADKHRPQFTSGTVTQAAESTSLNTSQLPVRKGSNISRHFPKVVDSENSLLRTSSVRSNSRSCADSGFKSESLVSSARDSDVELSKDGKLERTSEVGVEPESPRRSRLAPEISNTWTSPSQSSYCPDTSELMDKLDDFSFLVSSSNVDRAWQDMSLSNVERARRDISARLEQAGNQVGEPRDVPDRGVSGAAMHALTLPRPGEAPQQTGSRVEDYERETPPPDGQAAFRDTNKPPKFSVPASKPISPHMARKPGESFIDELKRVQAVRVSKSDCETNEIEAGNYEPLANERKHSGRPGVAMNESRYRHRNQTDVHPDTVSRSGLDRGDMSGVAGGVGGFVPDHHIPDGTEYSQQSEVHVDRKGISRDNLVGTEDIGLADSRGFDAIRRKTNRNPAAHVEDRSVRGDSIPADRQHMSNALNCADNQMGVSVQNKSKQSLNLQPARSFSPLTRNPAHVPVSKAMTQTREMTIDVHKNVETQTFADIEKLESWTQTSIVLRQSIDLQQGGEQTGQQERPSEQLQPDNRKATSEPRNPATLGVDQQRQTDEMKRTEKPVLLSRDSLLQTEFAQQYLKRDLSLEVMDRIYRGSQHSFQQMDASATDTTANMSQRCDTDWTMLQGNTTDTITDFSKLNEVTRLDQNLTKFQPSAQSTPFVPTTSNAPLFPGSRVSAPAVVAQHSSHYSMTTLTPSSMHTLSSTGFTSHAATDGDLTSQLADAGQGRSSLCSVEVPGVLRFPDACCVGISKKEVLALRNPTDKWLECNVEVKVVKLDGRPIPVENSPFKMRVGKVIINPYKTETVDVMFMPKVSGAYVAQVHVYTMSFLRNKAVEKNVMPVSTTFQALAEEPHIQVSCDDEEKELIHFGEIPWGQCREKTLHIRNLSTATVPLRLAIISTGAWHCFSFESEGRSSDVSTISGGRLPLMSGQGKGIVNLCLPGAGQPFNHHELNVWCWPPDKNSDRARARQPAEEFSCVVNVELDIPCSKFPVLHSLHLRAVVGIQKLHIQANLQELQLSCSPRKERTSGVSIYNAGNLSLNVAFGFSAHKDVFSVSPPSCVLRPGVDTEITVTFRPQGTPTIHFQTLLLMLIQPKGPLFELKIQGDVTDEPPKAADLNIQCDCTNLDFGGAVIGSRSVKRFRLINKGDKPVTMITEVRIDNFMLVLSPDQSSGGSRLQEICLEPDVKTPVYVVYSPTVCSAPVSGKIVMKAINYSKRFTVFVSGYGGVSKLCCTETTAGQTSVGGHPCIGIHSLATERVKHLYIHNLGSQTAIVNVNAYRDLQCRQRLSAGQIVVQPGDFLVAPRGQQHVELVFSMSDAEFFHNCQNHEVGAALSFSYTDKVDSKRPHTSNLTIGLVRAESHSSVSQHIPTDAFTTPSKSSYTMPRPSHFSQTVLTEPQEGVGDHVSWSVRPDEMVLDCLNRSEMKKFYICNDGATDISFELFWSGGMLSLVPDRGVVTARENKCVRVSPSVQTSQALDQLPWTSSIKVISGHTVKEVRVKLHKDVDNIPVGDERLMVPIAPHVAPAPLMSSQRLGELEVSRTVVEFGATRSGATTDELLELRNLGGDTIRWMFISFAPPYLKKKSDNKEVFRLSYKVFEFSHQFGKLSAHNTVQLAIKFMPRSAGIFSQYWDVQAVGTSSGAAPSSDEYIRFHFTGEGIEEDEGKTKATTILLEDVLPRPSDYNRLKMDKDTMVFPSIGAGSCIMQKVEMKNSHVEDVKVEVIGPKPPFSIKHTSFKIAKKRYLRFPVEFHPTRAGKYSDEVHFQGSRGDNLVLKVTAECC